MCPRQLAEQFAVLDTGARSNFVNYNCLSVAIRDLIEHESTPVILNEKRNPLKVVGYIRLWILFDSHLVRRKFVVCQDLVAPCILGFIYINRDVRAILPSEKRVRMKDSSHAPLISTRQFVKQIRTMKRRTVGHTEPQLAESVQKQEKISPVRIVNRVAVSADHQA